MPCYYPMQGWRSRKVNDNGKREIVFDRSRGYQDLPVTLPCGQCVGCRLEKSREWGVRCVHEASLYDSNCFITLTYDEQYLPKDGSVNVEHFKLFMKRMRKKNPGKKIRYFHCGEYGEQNDRPHYHACIFNHDFDDKMLFDIKNGHRLYVSEELNKLWPQGLSVIGDLTFQSAAYVARYCMKKITGDASVGHYININTETGEFTEIQPEYATMSLKPGIATGFYEKYKSDMFPSDFITVDGKMHKPPKFYDGIYEVEDIAGFEQMKKQRKVKANQRKEDNTTERLIVREKVKKAQVKQLSRKLEEK